MDYIKKPLVTNIDTVDKEVKSRKDVVEEANTSPIQAKNNTDTVKKSDKSKQPKKQSIPPKNKPNTLN